MEKDQITRVYDAVNGSGVLYPTNNRGGDDKHAAYPHRDFSVFVDPLHHEWRIFKVGGGDPDVIEPLPSAEALAKHVETAAGGVCGLTVMVYSEAHIPSK